jgi:hypothetical protein
MTKIRRMGGAVVLAGMMAGGLGTATLEATKPGGGGGNAAICAYLKKIIAYPNTSPYIRAYALSLWSAYGCK